MRFESSQRKGTIQNFLLRSHRLWTTRSILRSTTLFARFCCCYYCSTRCFRRCQLLLLLLLFVSLFFLMFSLRPDTVWRSQKQKKLAEYSVLNFLLFIAYNIFFIKIYIDMFIFSEIPLLLNWKFLLIIISHKLF